MRGCHCTRADGLDGEKGAEAAIAERAADVRGSGMVAGSGVRFSLLMFSGFWAALRRV